MFCEISISPQNFLQNCFILEFLCWSIFIVNVVNGIFSLFKEFVKSLNSRSFIYLYDEAGYFYIQWIEGQMGLSYHFAFYRNFFSVGY